jgi:hypothetical protein
MSGIIFNTDGNYEALEEDSYNIIDENIKFEQFDDDNDRESILDADLLQYLKESNSRTFIR